MIRHIGTVKKEIRILGLDACRPGRIVGAVVRGGLYLDGILVIPERGISKSIIASRYYPELRAVMLHNSDRRFDSRTIESEMKLPTLSVSSKLRRGSREYRSKHGTLSIKTTIPRPTMERILALTWTGGRLPEPIRIAHLLAMARIAQKPSSMR